MCNRAMLVRKSGRAVSTLNTSNTQIQYIPIHIINTCNVHKIQIHPATNVRFLSTDTTSTSTNTVTPDTNWSYNDYIQHGISLVLFGTFGYLLAQAYAYVTDFPEPCSIILSVAQNSTESQYTIGNQITTNGLYNGNVSDTRATISIPIKGSKDTGILHGKLYRASIDEPWRIVYLQYSIGSRSQRYSINTDTYNNKIDQQIKQSTQVTGIDMSQLPDSVKAKMNEQIQAYHPHVAEKQKQQNT